MPSLKNKTQLENNVKTAELRIAAFAAERNIAFNVLDHLSQIISGSFTDSEIAKTFSASRTKTTALVKNVLGAYSFEKTIDILQSKTFSLIVDESTDKGTLKSLALVARVVDNGIDDIFLGLLQVPDSTANGLYFLITNFFNTHAIDYKKK